MTDTEIKQTVDILLKLLTNNVNNRLSVELAEGILGNFNRELLKLKTDKLDEEPRLV